MENSLTRRADPQGDSNSAQTDFHWKRSDNSFAFNFLPAASSSLTHAMAAAAAEAQAQPRQGEGSDTGSSFAFNFQIPSGTAPSTGQENGATQAGKTEMEVTAIEPNADSSKSKAKKKKKKKGGGGGKEDGLQNKMIEEAPKQESTELSPEQQLNRELDWCIEQLELGLKTQKSSTKQREDASRALKTLQSSKAQMVKKRQVMRSMCGDYRRKMEEEKNRQFKLIQSAMTSAKVTVVSEPSRKPVFHRHAETKTHTTSNTDKPQDTHGLSRAAEQTDADMSLFVFRPSQEEFRFNFDL
ncbi:UPF0488 protein C8orf33 homolog isoform X2 [Pygocentrus nattereri]|uniref:Uncharacterized protein n=1 Tax=Pygocentrus nattereri TaxID=42514 RepID=A0A3B4C4D2_PYGNA|nr:UPF0488 protein C8orf33 homolog isoform X2 [Pygocentrus nattereri]XP_017556296.1 UPF0488 protein C8orf33 homolog isoform X2 [Pygocentrus nattereri]